MKYIIELPEDVFKRTVFYREFRDINDCVTTIKALEKAKELENQKTGHWIELGCVGNDNYDFECSKCHHTDTQSKTVKVNYCWFCGAKMEELKGEEGNV